MARVTIMNAMATTHDEVPTTSIVSALGPMSCRVPSSSRYGRYSRYESSSALHSHTCEAAISRNAIASAKQSGLGLQNAPHGAIVLCFF
ncbi:MAG: hypothetical protein OXU37_03490 [Thaumarchaeota archaeon]|nr:hypothetical protein [Nitrososphaerota archaeon]MDD9813318.1 hypothetical protein [Nitrososphaerota archaeon]